MNRRQLFKSIVGGAACAAIAPKSDAVHVPFVQLPSDASIVQVTTTASCGATVTIDLDGRTLARAVVNRLPQELALRGVR
jgi:hypothetical protein